MNMVFVRRVTSTNLIVVLSPFILYYDYVLMAAPSPLIFTLFFFWLPRPPPRTGQQKARLRLASAKAGGRGKGPLLSLLPPLSIC